MVDYMDDWKMDLDYTSLYIDMREVAKGNWRL